LGAIELWKNERARKFYMHYTGHGASSRDRVYLSPELFRLKQSAEIMAAAFTDHNAAAVKLRLDGPVIQRGRGRWKMNTTILQKDGKTDPFKQKWGIWTAKIKDYPNILTWWDKYVKKRWCCGGLSSCWSRGNVSLSQY
jgi:hypothetical protein